MNYTWCAFECGVEVMTGNHTGYKTLNSAMCAINKAIEEDCDGDVAGLTFEVRKGGEVVKQWVF